MSDELQLDRYEARGRRLSRIWLGVLWGLAEATVFFLVPDILITASALFAPRRSFAQMIAILIGALIGGALLYTAADKYPDETKAVVLQVPFIKMRTLEESDRQMQEHGMLAIPLGAFSGVPYKTYAVNAPRRAPFGSLYGHESSSPLRTFPFELGFSFIDRYFLPPPNPGESMAALALLAICWIGFYTYYWSVV